MTDETQQPTPPDPSAPQVPAEPLPAAGEDHPDIEATPVADEARDALGDLNVDPNATADETDPGHGDEVDVEQVAASYGNSGKFHTTAVTPVAE